MTFIDFGTAFNKLHASESRAIAVEMALEKGLSISEIDVQNAIDVFVNAELWSRAYEVAVKAGLDPNSLVARILDIAHQKDGFFSLWKFQDHFNEKGDQKMLDIIYPHLLTKYEQRGHFDSACLLAEKHGDSARAAINFENAVKNIKQYGYTIDFCLTKKPDGTVRSPKMAQKLIKEGIEYYVTKCNLTDWDGAFQAFSFIGFLSGRSSYVSYFEPGGLLPRDPLIPLDEILDFATRLMHKAQTFDNWHRKSALGRLLNAVKELPKGPRRNSLVESCAKIYEEPPKDDYERNNNVAALYDLAKFENDLEKQLAISEKYNWSVGGACELRYEIALKNGNPDLIAKRQKEVLEYFESKEDYWRAHWFARKIGDRERAIRYLKLGRSYFTLIEYVKDSYTAEQMAELYEKALEHHSGVADELRITKTQNKSYDSFNGNTDIILCGSLEQRRHNYKRAIELYVEGEQPHRGAELAEKVGLHAEAQKIYESLVRRGDYGSLRKIKGTDLYQEFLPKAEKVIQESEVDRQYSYAALIARNVDDEDRAAIYEKTSQTFEEVGAP